MNIRSIENTIFEGGNLSQGERKHLCRKAKDYWDYHPDVSINFPKWKKYLAWTAGFQTYDYNRKLNKTVDVLTIANKKRKLIFNRIKVFVRTLLAKMSAEVHHAGVIPITSDSDDIEASRLGTRVVEALKEKLGAENIELILKLWLIIINRAYLRVFWNEEDFGITGYRQKEQVDEDGEIVVDEDGQPVLTEERVPTKESGDVGLEAVNPFMCRYDPLYTDRKKWRWFEYGEVVDAEALEEEYGLETGTLKGETDSVETPWDIEISGTGDASIMSPDKKEDVMGRTTLKLYFWTPKVWAIISDDKVLDWGVNKYKEIPFFRLEEKLIPIENTEKGLNLNDSMVQSAIPIQREYNKQKTIISRALTTASKLKVMLPLNSMISKKFWNNEFGTFLDVNTSLGKPEQLKLDPLPSFVQLHLSDLEREFETAFSTHEASFGRLPERASHASGALVHILLEQDDVILNPMLRMINRSLSEAWSLILRIVQDNYQVSRLLRYAGKNGEYSVMSFRGAQLRGNTDVKIVSQTGLPKSRIARTEYIMKLREAQLIDDKQALELIEFGSAERVFESNLIHQNRARRENLAIEKNPEITEDETISWVYRYEDHLTHLPIHIEDRLSGKFDNYNEKQRRALDAHIEATRQLIIELQMEIARAQSPQPEEETISEEPVAEELPPGEQL